MLGKQQFNNFTIDRTAFQKDYKFKEKAQGFCEVVVVQPVFLEVIPIELAVESLSSQP